MADKSLSTTAKNVKIITINGVVNIVVGIIGAMVAGFLLTPLFGIGTINQNSFSLPALFVSPLGAIILLAIVNLFRRVAVR